MADVESKVNIKVSAENKAGAAFDQLGKQIGLLESGSGKLSSTLTKLGALGAGLYIGNKLVNFFKSSVEASMEAQKEMAQIEVNIRNAGLAFEEAMPIMEEFGNKAIQLGFDDEEAMTSLSRFAMVTKDYGKQQNLANLAMDMARAKGVSLESTTRTLMSVMAGNTRALKEYGISLDSDASSAEALDALQIRLKGSAEAFAKTNAGQMQVMAQTWVNFKEQIGDTFGPALNIALTNFNKFLTVSNSNAKKWGDSMAERLAILVNPDTWKLTGKVVMTGVEEVSSKIVGLGMKVLNFFGAGLEPMEDPIEREKQAIIDLANKIKEATNTAVNFQNQINLDKLPPNSNLFAGLGKDAEDTSKEADKLADAFKTFSKSVVDSLNDQQKAVDSLRASLKELDDDLNDSIEKSNEKYQQDVTNLARKAKENIDTINKQIAEEKDTMNRGWRDKVAELEKQKKEEQAIIDRAGGVVKNLDLETSKDEMTILQETHKQELAELQKQHDEKMNMINNEIASRQEQVKNIQSMVTAKGFFESVAAESSTFLNAIGASQNQQTLVFNFNGAVAGDEGIKKIIKDTVSSLDRTATLKNISGK